MVHSTEHWALGQWPSSSQQTYGSQITVCGFGGHVTLQYAIDATIDAYNKGLAYCYMCEIEYQSLPSWLPQYADAIRAWQGAGPSPFTKTITGTIPLLNLRGSLQAQKESPTTYQGWGWGGYDSVWLAGNLQSHHIGDGGKIYRILPADLELSGALTGTPDTPPEASTCVCIAASGDDGHTGEYGHHTTPTWYEIGQVASGAWYESWFMFRNVVLPIGASMTKATLRTVHTQWGCNTQLKIRAVKLSNPANPVSMADYRSLARTIAAVDWNAGFDDSLWHDSPNIKSVIQELIDTYDFSSGRDILVMVDNDGCAAGISHVGVSYDNGPGCYSPQLHLEYSVSAPPVVEEKYLVGKLNHTFFPMGGVLTGVPKTPRAGGMTPSGGVATLVKVAVGGELTSAGIGSTEKTYHKSVGGNLVATDMIGVLERESGFTEVLFTPVDLDATLDQENPATNYGAEEAITVNGKNTESHRMILEWDLTALPNGVTIKQACMALYYHMYSGICPAGETVRFHRCTRPNDAVENEVTWNIYKAASNWTVAGGDYAGAEYADGVVPNTVSNYMWCCMKDIVQDAIDNRAEILTLIGKYLTEADAGNMIASFRSSEYTGDAVQKPRIYVSYYDEAALIIYRNVLGSIGLGQLTGTLTAKLKVAVAGGMTPTGLGMAGIYWKSLSGGMTPAGVGSGDKETKHVQPVAGSFSSTGIVGRKTCKALAGAVSASGTPFPIQSIELNGEVTPAGVVYFTTVAGWKHLAGELTLSGSLVKGQKKTVAGNVYLHLRSQSVTIRR